MDSSSESHRLEFLSAMRHYVSFNEEYASKYVSMDALAVGHRPIHSLEEMIELTRKVQNVKKVFRELRKRK